MASIAPMVAAKVMPLIMNTQPVPTAATSRPATPGPIIRAALKEAEFRATALASEEAGTMSETKTCLAGRSEERRVGKEHGAGRGRAPQGRNRHTAMDAQPAE